MAYTGLTVDDMDVIELNEAFAAQVSPCIKELGLNPAKVNPNGGAMALGHPLGATGAVLSCKAISELRRTGGKYALVTMCIAGGMGARPSNFKNIPGRLGRIYNTIKTKHWRRSTWVSP